MRLILVRHGETDWNRDHRFQGQCDIELNGVGKQQAERLAWALKNEKIAAVYSSPLRRARQTAAAIAQFHRVEVETEAGLAELDLGDMDGLTSAEARDRYGDILREWGTNPAPVKMPGGESLQELQMRAWASIERIVESHPDSVVVAVSHSFAILSIICKALTLDLSAFRRLRQDLAAMSALDFGQRGVVLVLLNDTSHLRTGGPNGAQ